MAFGSKTSLRLHEEPPSPSMPLCGAPKANNQFLLQKEATSSPPTFSPPSPASDFNSSDLYECLKSRLNNMHQLQATNGLMYTPLLKDYDSSLDISLQETPEMLSPLRAQLTPFPKNGNTKVEQIPKASSTLTLVPAPHPDTSKPVSPLKPVPPPSLKPVPSPQSPHAPNPSPKTKSFKLTAHNSKPQFKLRAHESKLDDPKLVHESTPTFKLQVHESKPDSPDNPLCPQPIKSVLSGNHKPDYKTALKAVKLKTTPSQPESPQTAPLKRPSEVSAHSLYELPDVLQFLDDEFNYSVPRKQTAEVRKITQNAWCNVINLLSSPACAGSAVPGTFFQKSAERLRLSAEEIRRLTPKGFVDYRDYRRYEEPKEIPDPPPSPYLDFRPRKRSRTLPSHCGGEENELPGVSPKPDVLGITSKTLPSSSSSPHHSALTANLRAKRVTFSSNTISYSATTPIAPKKTLKPQKLEKDILDLAGLSMSQDVSEGTGSPRGSLMTAYGFFERDNDKKTDELVSSDVADGFSSSRSVGRSDSRNSDLEIQNSRWGPSCVLSSKKKSFDREGWKERDTAFQEELKIFADEDEQTLADMIKGLEELFEDPNFSALEPAREDADSPKSSSWSESMYGSGKMDVDHLESNSNNRPKTNKKPIWSKRSKLPDSSSRHHYPTPTQSSKEDKVFQLPIIQISDVDEIKVSSDIRRRASSGEKRSCMEMLSNSPPPTILKRHCLTQTRFGHQRKEAPRSHPPYNKKKCKKTRSRRLWRRLKVKN